MCSTVMAQCHINFFSSGVEMNKLEMDGGSTFAVTIILPRAKVHWTLMHYSASHLCFHANHMRHKTTKSVNHPSFYKQGNRDLERKGWCKVTLLAQQAYRCPGPRSFHPTQLPGEDILPLMSNRGTFRKFSGEWGYLQVVTSINFFLWWGSLESLNRAWCSW